MMYIHWNLTANYYILIESQKYLCYLYYQYIINQNSHFMMNQHKSLLIVTLLFVQGYSQDIPTSLLTITQRWIYGILSGLGLSLLGFIAAIILVGIGKKIANEKFKKVIKILYALACGSLLGDAVLHILSQAYKSQDNNEYIVSIIFILSLLTFILIERLFIYFGISHSHQVQIHSHDEEEILIEKKDSLIQQSIVTQTDKMGKAGCIQNLKGKGSSGYLNLLGSFIHNWIDGIAVGLSFATGDKMIFGPVLIAIFAHEIPRQLGDVAILLENKFTNCQTIMSNGIINLLSLIGVIAGLATSGLSDVVQSYIMVFVAGNFIFISSDIWKHLFKDEWYMNLLQIIGFLSGIGAMLGIKFLEG